MSPPFVRLVLCMLAFIWPVTQLSAQEAKLRKSDTIQVKISGVPPEEETLISDLYTIDDRGAIELPYINVPVKAEGLTASTLARRIKDIYKATKIFKYPSVSITAAGAEATSNRRVAVSGEVVRETIVPFNEGMRLLESITAAGGFTDFADKKRVKVIRGNQTFTCDLRYVSRYPEQNLSLQPSDQVIVPHR